MAQNKKKIIIIDDVELNRAILKESFSSEYDIIEAEDGDKGLQKIFENEQDLQAIFLDVIMPEVDGFSVLQELDSKNITKKIPLFIITTEATDYVIEHSYEYGVADVIQKPFNMRIIKRRVNNAIELYDAREKLKNSSNLCNASSSLSSSEQKYKKALIQIANIINAIAKEE